MEVVLFIVFVAIALILGSIGIYCLRKAVEEEEGG